MKKKDEDILELRKKIEDMSNEFARMLKVTNLMQGNPWEDAGKSGIGLMGQRDRSLHDKKIKGNCHQGSMIFIKIYL